MRYDFSLPGWHYKGLVKTLVKMAGLTGDEQVLDFGCGHQDLKSFLPRDCLYTGYDIIPALSDVAGYRSLKHIDVVFCNAVLEHMNDTNLRNLLQEFRKMKIKKLVTWFPSSNILQRFLEVLFNADAINRFNHFQEAEKITNALVDTFGMPVKVKRYHLIAYLAVFEIGTDRRKKT